MSPEATGSPTPTMTIGIVSELFFAAMDASVTIGDQDINRQTEKFTGKLRKPVEPPVGESGFNGDVGPLDVAVIPKPLAQAREHRRSTFRCARAQKADPGSRRVRLRVDRAERYDGKQHHAGHESRNHLLTPWTHEKEQGDRGEADDANDQHVVFVRDEAEPAQCAADVSLGAMRTTDRELSSPPRAWALPTEQRAGKAGQGTANEVKLRIQLLIAVRAGLHALANPSLRLRRRRSPHLPPPRTEADHS